MSNRSANATILGYLYQFDFSISKILDTPENDEIELEGLEDIDITQDNAKNLYQCLLTFKKIKIKNIDIIYMETLNLESINIITKQPLKKKEMNL